MDTGHTRDTGRLSSLRNLLGISLGGLGVVICVAALVVIWIVRVRVGQLNENVFAGLDRTLVAVGQRVSQTRDRVRDAKLTTADVEKSLLDWTKRRAGERVAAQLNAQEKADRVSALLQQAGDWLEIAESSAGLVNELLSNLPRASEQADVPSLGRLIEEIAAARAQLAEAADVVARIRERIVAVGDEKSRQERIEQAAQLTVRVADTLGSLDSRLEKFGGRVSEVQDRLRELKTRTSWWIRVVTVGVTLLILLMAAGQFALCWLAWNGWRYRAPADSSWTKGHPDAANAS
jgi:hypothetical protein